MTRGDSTPLPAPRGARNPVLELPTKAVVQTAISRPLDHRDELYPSYAAARGLPLRGSNREQQVPPSLMRTSGSPTPASRDSHLFPPDIEEEGPCDNSTLLLASNVEVGGVDGV